MLTCPTCGGRIDERCCAGCGRVFRTIDLFGHLPVPEQVRQEQDEREDFAVRESG